jgi:hypothetical protein
MGVGKLIYFFFLLGVLMGVVIQNYLLKILKTDVVMSDCLMGVDFLGSRQTKRSIMAFFLGVDGSEHSNSRAKKTPHGSRRLLHPAAPLNKPSCMFPCIIRTDTDELVCFSFTDP